MKHVFVTGKTVVEAPTGTRGICTERKYTGRGE
jgi:hypothetical protein